MARTRDPVVEFYQTAVIDGRTFLEWPRHRFEKGGALHDPRGDVFVCAHCGFCYARLPVWLGAVKMQEFRVHRGVCHQCKNEAGMWGYTADSVWLDWDSAYTNDLPEAIVKREFNMLLKHYEDEANGKIC